MSLTILIFGWNLWRWQCSIFGDAYTEQIKLSFYDNMELKHFPASLWKQGENEVMASVTGQQEILLKFKDPYLPISL
jgi:hypothetical protein